MKFPFKRILIYSLCLVLVFSCVFPLASSTVSAFSLDVLTDNFSVTTLWEMVQGSDCVGISDYLSAITSKTDDGCTVSEDGYHLWLCRDTTVGLLTNAFPLYCAYCNESYASYIGKDSLDSSDIEDVYNDYVSSLDSPVVSSTSLIQIPISSIKASSGSYSSLSYFIDSFGFNGCCSDKCILDVYCNFTISESGYYCFNFPCLSLSSNFGVWSSKWVCGVCRIYDSSNSIYCNLQSLGLLNQSSTCNVYLDKGSYTFVCQSFSVNSVGDFSVSSNSNITCSHYYCMSSYFNSLSNYNTTNNYTDNSDVVNYYIGTTDDTGDVTNIYNVSLYDESSLIFTEPVTETQYQTTGWTYDYTTRTYTLDLDSGTFYVGDYDIDTIDLTYGDDALTITYYADGVAITTDEYVYVMVSQSECALNGHTYSLEDYQAPHLWRGRLL